MKSLTDELITDFIRWKLLIDKYYQNIRRSARNFHVLDIRLIFASKQQ